MGNQIDFIHCHASLTLCMRATSLNTPKVLRPAPQAGAANRERGHGTRGIAITSIIRERSDRQGCTKNDAMWMLGTLN